MLDLGKGNMMQELDEELAGKIGLVTGESFDSNENGRGGNDEGVQSVDSRCRKKSESDWLRIGQGNVGRFVRGRCQKVWHLYGRELEHR